MNFLRKLSAAITGELLFRLVHLFEDLILLPISCYEMFQAKSLELRAFHGIISVGLALFATSILILEPISLLGCILGFAVLIYPRELYGAHTGWEHGFQGVFDHLAERFDYIKFKLMGVRYLPVPPLNVAPITIDLEPLIVRFDTIPVEPMNIDVNLFRNLYQRPQIDFTPFEGMHREFFRHLPQSNPGVPKPLDLTAEEFSVLVNNQHRLFNADERTLLRSISNAEIKKTVDNYLTLWDRLEETGECSILLRRPEKENAVLLVKLYSRDGRDYPVPLSSYLFDKDSLEEWVSVNTTSPITKQPVTGDSIHTPSLYEGHTTRYVRHPYYANSESTSGISQELSDLAGILKPHLDLLLKPAESERDRVIAARLRFYGGAANSRDGDQDHANVPKWP